MVTENDPLVTAILIEYKGDSRFAAIITLLLILFFIGVGYITAIIIQPDTFTCYSTQIDSVGNKHVLELSCKK